MSLPSRYEQLASIRDEARTLAQRAGEHEERLHDFVASSETFVRYAEAAFANAIESSSGLAYLRSLLQTQLQRGIEEAEIARQLSSAARAQHAAARRLLTHLADGDGESRVDNGLQRNAVLVADDYLEVRELVALVLEEAGFAVRTAANGLEALLAAYEMRPAVIVMDVTMPVLDGVEATRLIKASDATRHARVIAYTGNPAVEGRAGQALFAAVLRKPAPVDVVLSTVRQVANR
jgi:two-component system, cell cycle response regulator DivK